MAEEGKKSKKKMTQKQLDNLVPLSMRDKETAKKIQSKGGKASQEAHRQRRKFQEDAATILNLALQDGRVLTVEDIESLAKENLKDANLPLQQLMIIAMSQAVLKEHNVRAFDSIVKLMGESTDKVEITGSLSIQDDPQVKAFRERWKNDAEFRKKYKND